MLLSWLFGVPWRSCGYDCYGQQCPGFHFNCLLISGCTELGSRSMVISLHWAPVSMALYVPVIMLFFGAVMEARSVLDGFT